MLYADNKQISGRQASRIILLALFAAACMTIPEIAIVGGQKQALFAVIIGTAATVAYTWLIVTVMFADLKNSKRMGRRETYANSQSDRRTCANNQGACTEYQEKIITGRDALGADKNNIKKQKSREALQADDMEKKDFYHMLQVCFGKHTAQCIMVYFRIKFVVAAIYILRMFQEVISRTFLTEISGWLTGVLALGAAYYIAGRGVETQGRMSELITWMALLPILIVVGLSFSQLQVSRLVPLCVENTTNLLQNSAHIWAAFSTVEILLFLLPYVKKTQWKKRYFLWDVVVAGAVAVLVLAACIGVLSAQGTASEAWPSVILMQVIKLPWHFISRQEGVLLGFWMPAAIMLLAGYLLFLGVIAQNVLNKNHCRWTDFVIVMIVYVGANCIRDFEYFESVYLKWQFWLGVLPTTLLLFIMFFKIVKCRRRNIKKGMQSKEIQDKDTQSPKIQSNDIKIRDTKSKDIQTRNKKIQDKDIQIRDIQNKDNIEKIFLKHHKESSALRKILKKIYLKKLKIQKKSSTRQFLSYCRFIGFLALAALLSGCGRTPQIEDRNYVMAIGIDYVSALNNRISSQAYRIDASNNHEIYRVDYDVGLGTASSDENGYFKVSMSFPDVGALTGNDGPEPEAPMTIFVKHLQDIEAVYENQASEQLDFSQLQVILLGENLLKHKDMLKSTADYMRQHRAFTRTTYICATENDSSEVVALDTEVNGSVGIYIKDMIENNYEMNHEDAKACILNDFIIAMENSAEKIKLNMIGVEDDRPVFMDEVFRVGNSKF